MSKLTLCKTCGKEISTSAKSCPHCGQKLKKGKFKIIGIAAAAIIVLIAIASSGGNSNTSKQTSQSTSTNKNDTKKDSITTVYSDIVSGFKDSNPKLSKKSSDFIAANSTLFPATSDQDKAKIEGMVDKSIGYKHLEKSIDDYLDKVIQVQGNVIDVQEHKSGDKTFTYMHFITDDGDSFQIVYLGKVDIFKNDKAICVGLPVAQNNFSNVSGGTTRAIVVVASTVKKVPSQQ